MLGDSGQQEQQQQEIQQNPTKNNKNTTPKCCQLTDKCPESQAAGEQGPDEGEEEEENMDALLSYLPGLQSLGEDALDNFFSAQPAPVASSVAPQQQLLVEFIRSRQRPLEAGTAAPDRHRLGFFGSVLE